MCSFLWGAVQSFPLIHVPTCHSHQLPASPTRLRDRLHLVNLHWLFNVPQTPWFALGFALGVVHSMRRDKCTMTLPKFWYYTEHFLCPRGRRILSLPHIYLSAPPPPAGNYGSFHCFYSLAYWQCHTDRITYTTWLYQMGFLHLVIVFKFPHNGFLTSQLVSFWCGIIVHIWIDQFTSLFLSGYHLGHFQILSNVIKCAI